MKIKSLATACAVLALSYATPSQAGVGGYFLAMFKYPGGTFSHCFALTKTGQYPGYPSSGTWVDTDFPDTAGTYVIYKKTVHLAGYVGGGEPGLITLDGQISSGILINATFDYFTGSGIYFAAGSFTEVRDPTCKPSN